MRSSGNHAVSSEITNYPGKAPGDRISKIQWVPIRIVHPTEKLPTRQITLHEYVPAIIVEFGPDHEGEDSLYIVDGHHRYKAFLDAGYKEIPVRTLIRYGDTGSLTVQHNPPKLDRVAVRYASRIADQVIAGIKAGKINGDTLYEERGSSFRGHWEYGLKIGKRPINLTVVSPLYEGNILVPDDVKLPVKITTPGWRIPDRTMLVHEIVHYLQAERGLFHGTARGTEIADYLDQTHERDAYFVQMVSTLKLTRVKDPAKTVKKYFSGSGLWQVMKPQTRQHHIDRLTDLLTFT